MRAAPAGASRYGKGARDDVAGAFFVDGAPAGPLLSGFAMVDRRRVAQAGYCAALLTVLGAVQVRAEILQVESGYRPFARAPVRVPYSWDMFAIRMDRCVVTWSPPLWIDGQPVATWHDRAYPIEFDTIFNGADQYAAVARYACAFRGDAPTEARVTCAMSEGRMDERRFACP